MQLDVEREYEVDDPTGLTFAYTRCIDAQKCASVFRDDQNKFLENLGVVFDGRRILPGGAAGDVQPACRLAFFASPQSQR